MESLMKKAITDFKKLKLGEIRSVQVYEASKERRKITYAMFKIEYCDKSGIYQECYIKEDK